MKGLNNFPPSLPASIYASATGRPSASPLVRNTTLHVNSPPPIPKRSPVFAGRQLPPTTVNISPEEYQKYQTFFKQLDTDQSGFVSGADAVVFFRHSKLPESDLAKIWDLADTNSSGMLTEQEFAIAMHMINGRVKGGDLPNALPTFNIQPAQQQPFAPPSQQHQNVDLLGLSDLSAPPPPLQQHDTVNLARSQSTMIQSSVTTETHRAQTAHQQFNQESQAVQELLHQIENQKEALAKMKSEAEEAERLLALEKKRKEELSQELQMYRQETKHFSTRVENAKEETQKVKTEIEELQEKAKKASENPKDDVFSLSSAPSPAIGGLFAKVNESPSLFPKGQQGSPLFAKVNESPVSSHSTGQKVFDPFAGFKATSSSTPSPSPSINKLKAETEQKSTTPTSSHLDISDIESKYPDLSTMEQNFAPAAPAPTTSAAPESPKKAQTPSSQAKTSVSKYGFDLSAFESSATTDTTSMKDELSSLFSSPSTSNAPLPSNGFDDIFGQPTAKKSINFEDIFK